MMRKLRNRFLAVLLTALLLLLLTGCSATPGLLIGTWKCETPEDFSGLTFTFDENGEYQMSGFGKNSGTYTLEGKTLTLFSSVTDSLQSPPMTIESISEDTLILRQSVESQTPDGSDVSVTEYEFVFRRLEP